MRDSSLDTFIDEHGERRPTEAKDRPRLCSATGGHTVEKPKVWPPRLRSMGRSGRDYASVTCQRCGAWVIVYEPLQPGVRWADEAPPPKAA